MSLFDASLHHIRDSLQQGKLRLATISMILGGGKTRSVRYVVGNHDTQPLQALEAPVEQCSSPWPMR